jgi:hypothetical protein
VRIESAPIGIESARDDTATLPVHRHYQSAYGFIVDGGWSGWRHASRASEEVVQEWMMFDRYQLERFGGVEVEMDWTRLDSLSERQNGEDLAPNSGEVTIAWGWSSNGGGSDDVTAEQPSLIDGLRRCAALQRKRAIGSKEDQWDPAELGLDHSG